MHGKETSGIDNSSGSMLGRVVTEIAGDEVFGSGGFGAFEETVIVVIGGDREARFGSDLESDAFKPRENVRGALADLVELSTQKYLLILKRDFA